MTTETDKLMQPKEYIDDPRAMEVYIDGTSGFGVVNGTVAITLEALRWEHGPGNHMPKRVVVARLRMPVAAAQTLAVALFDFLDKSGFNPTGKPQNQPVQ